MEFWVISTPGELAFVNNMMQGSESAAFEDADGATMALGIGLFEVLVMDQEHNVVSRYNSFIGLVGDHNRAVIDADVTNLLNAP